MKIFNWVHRRFYNNEKGRKNELGEFEDENMNDEVRGWGWGGGGLILSIGTLGSYDPDRSVEEEINGVLKSHCDYNTTHEEEEEEETNVDDDEEEEKEEICGEDIVIEREEEETSNNGFEYVMMEKRARTTLADLFTAADNNSEEKEDINNIINKKKQQQQSSSALKKHKHKSTLTKKLLRLKLDDESPPIHKLNQLMRRMLKRKIHPDQIGVLKKCDINNDHASLLPLDAII